MSVSVTEIDTVDLEKEIAEMHSRLGKKQHQSSLRVAFITGLFRYSDGQVNLLSGAESSEHYVTVYKQQDDFDKPAEIDIEATNKLLKKIMEYATRTGHGAKKNLADDYLHVVVPLEIVDTKYNWRNINVTFNASRETVCEKIVTEEVVPAQPETTRKVVSYDCKKVSFLGMKD